MAQLSEILAKEQNRMDAAARSVEPRLFSKTVKDIKAVIAIGSHLFPFRTESLNLSSPMVLHHNVGE